MKRITKLLAMGMAMALTFGMTVSASEVENPSRKTDVTIDVADGASVTPLTGDAWTNAMNEAQIQATGIDQKMGNALIKAGVPASDAHDIECEVYDVFYVTAGLRNGKLIVPNGVAFYERYYGYDVIKDYDHTWGAAVVRLADTKVYRLTQNTTEVVDASGQARVVVDNYTTGVAHEPGHAYALVTWRLKYITEEPSNAGNLTTEIEPDKGTVEVPFTEHAARAHALLWPKSDNNPDGRNLGNILAAKYCGSLYGFQALKGTTRLNLTDNSSVWFDLPHLDADHKYLVMLHPYNINTTDKSVNNWPDYDIDNPYTVELTEVQHSHIDGSCAFSAQINKGSWLATVFEVAVDPKNVPADPTPVTSVSTTTAGDANVAGSGVAGATTAGGVVSPKTGEMLPVATILAAVCLVGAAVCAKKARKDA